MTALESAKERLQEAKKVSLIGLLKELGYKLDDTGSNYKMISPFRAENEGSFFIDKRRPNKWKDYGNGKSGDVIDLVQDLFNFTKKEAIDYLLKRQNITLPVFEPVKRDRNAIEILSKQPLSDPWLVKYITDRKISLKTAQKWLVELTIRFPYGKTPDRESRVIGWKNDSGGYEIRTRTLKISNSPKNITTIKFDEHKKLTIFEGFFSFLSYLEHYKTPITDGTVVVLNTLSFLPQVISFYDKDWSVIGYLDNDKSGDRSTELIQQSGYAHFLDGRKAYYEYNDWNDLLTGKKRKIKRGTLSEILKLK